MKDLLILYPHGLGDCILLTPAIKEYSKRTGHKVHVATLERFKSAEFFKNNPYVDRVFYTKDAWHDYPNSQIGFQSLREEWIVQAKQLSFDAFSMPMHSEQINKIIINYRYLGMEPEGNEKTEVYTSNEDVELADKIISELVGNNPFGFVQTSTGVQKKDLPENFGRNFVKRQGVDHVIEIGKEIDPFKYNINVQFEILRRAKTVCLPDSVFYHACHAMGKKVDFVYFARGEEIYNRVRPLHSVQENVVYKL